MIIEPNSLFGSRYRIERELGRGGMAVVYLAEDARHRRRVALKLLRPELASILGGDRFLREIETTAGLQHPHILPLFDSGETEGYLFYVMPFVEGGTLRDRLDREGRLTLATAIGIMSEVAGALDHAHVRGILHRDIKPENILLSGGHALVADFGIARALAGDTSTRLTDAGLALGTPAYMSPEQAFDQQVGPASDQYSLACVLFEMMTGTVPFAAATGQAMLARRLREPPPTLASVGIEAPPHVEQALARALASEWGARFPSVAALAHALGSGETVAVARVPDRSVAVLEFINMSGSTVHDWLSTGIAETVSVDLRRVAGVRVVPRDQSARAAIIAPQRATELGRALGARWVVTGAFQVLGNRIRITPEFFDTTTDASVGASKLDGLLDDVFSLQDRIVAELLAALDIDPTRAEADEIARPETGALEAYQCYATGRQCFNRFGDKAFAEASKHFERAIELDPDYSQAHAGLGSIFVFRFISTTDPDDLATGIARLRRAVELDGGRAEPHQWLTYAYTRANRIDEAEEAGRRATALEPDNAMAHYFLAVASCVQGERRRDWDRVVQAAASFQRSIETEPAYLMAYGGLADLYLQSGQYADASRVLARAVKLEWSGRTRGPAILGSATYFTIRLAIREGRLADAETGIGELLVKMDRAEHVYTQVYRGLAMLARADLAALDGFWDRVVAENLRVRELALQNRHRLGMGHLYVRAQVGLAKAFLGLGDRQEAGRAFELGWAVFRNPGEWDLSWGLDMNEATDWINLAGYYASAGRRSDAISALVEAVDRGWGDFQSLARDPAFVQLHHSAEVEGLRARVRGRIPLPSF